MTRVFSIVCFSFYAFFFFLIFFDSHSASASLLETKSGTQQIEEIKLAESAVWLLGGTKQNLKMVSSGLRTKKIVFVNVSIYVAEWFVNSTAPWTHSIENIKSLAPVAMRMTFLRDIEAAKIESAFRESLLANKIDLTEPAFKAFLKAFLDNGDIKKKSTMTLAGHINGDGSEVLSFESTSNKVTEIKGPAGFLQKIYSIWFGESADSGLADLKKALLGPAK